MIAAIRNNPDQMARLLTRIISVVHSETYSGEVLSDEESMKKLREILNRWYL